MAPTPTASTNHRGEDTAGPGNYAPEAGVVVYVGYYGAYGWLIGIRVSPAVVWWIAHHADRGVVNVGQAVTEGQYIGPLGATGNVTGPHAHTERRVNGSNAPLSGTATNPRNYYTASGGGSASGEEDDMFTDADRAELARAANVQPLHTRVIRNTKTGDIVMLHPAGVTIIGQPMMPDIPTANGHGLMAGQPLNKDGGYWIDLPGDRFRWEMDRHEQLLAALDARIRSVAGGGSADLAPVEVAARNGAREGAAEAVAALQFPTYGPVA